MTAEVGIEWLPRRVHTDVRNRDAAALGLPARPNTTAPVAGGVALWLGPDEWLVLGGGWSAAAGLAAEQDWRSRAEAATDVSAQRVGLRVGGSGAAEVLSFGCALDLHPRLFGVGACAQTLVARVPVVLVRTEPTGYDILVRPSFASYLAAFLRDARDGACLTGG